MTPSARPEAQEMLRNALMKAHEWCPLCSGAGSYPAGKHIGNPRQEECEACADIRAALALPASPVVSRPASPGVRVPVRPNPQDYVGIIGGKDAYAADLVEFNKAMLAAAPSSQGNGDGVKNAVPQDAADLPRNAAVLDSGSSAAAPECGTQPSGSAGAAPYNLSNQEQQILKKALLKGAPHQRNGETAIETPDDFPDVRERIRVCTKLFHNAEEHWGCEMAHEWITDAPKEMTLLDWIHDGIDALERRPALGRGRES